MYTVLHVTSPDVKASHVDLAHSKVAQSWLEVGKEIATSKYATDFNFKFASSHINALYLVFETGQDISPIKFLLKGALTKVFGVNTKVITHSTDIQYMEDVFSYFLDIGKVVAGYRFFERDIENSFNGASFSHKDLNLRWHMDKRTAALKELYKALKVGTLQRIKTLLTCGLLLVYVSGCVPILRQVASDINLELESEYDYGTGVLDRSSDEPVPAEGLKYLLGDGWELRVFKGKLVLVKFTAKGLLVKDAFKTINKD